MINVPTEIITDLFGSIANIYDGTFVVIELLLSLTITMFLFRKVVQFIVVNKV